MSRVLQVSLAVVLTVLLTWFLRLGAQTPGGRDFEPAYTLGLDGPMAVAGVVELDEGVPAGLVQVQARYAALGVAVLSTAVDADGRFDLTGLLDDPVVLEVMAPGSEEPLEAIGPLDLAAVTDPLVVDLRGRLSIATVDVWGPDGLPVAEAQVAWRPSGMQAFRHFGLAMNGELVLATAVDPIDLYVQCAGARSQLIRDVVGQTRVELRPRISAQFELPAEVDPEADGVLLDGSVIRNAPPKILAGSTHAIIDYLRIVDRIQLSSNVPTSIEVPSSGSYRVEWRMFDAMSDDYLPFPGSPDPSTFEVWANLQGSTVVPLFPEELYRAALALR